MKAIMPSWISRSVFLLGVLASFAIAERRPFDLELEPSSDYVHFVEGFLITPGYVDLTNLRFQTVGETVDTGYDDEVLVDVDDDETLSQGDDNPNRQLDEGSEILTHSTLDLAVFHLPQECANTRLGCDWPDLGVGKRSEDGFVRYCCRDDAINMKLCQESQYGKLIMDASKFTGKHRFMNIPAEGDYDKTMTYGRFEQHDENGKYVLVMANCNDEGRPVRVHGTIIWKSRHGYLPGDLFGLMYFLAFVTLLYFILLAVYGILMKQYDDDNIPIQNWILATIAMGAIELFFRTGDLFVWNEDGDRLWVVFFVGLIVSVIKGGVSRCLLVMVALGWGVIRDDIGSVMTKIQLLGITYVVVCLAMELMRVIAYLEVHRISHEEEKEVLSVVTILRIVVAFINALFFLWIIDALNGTMEYLENMNQAMKLLRYLRLRMVLLFSILFAIMWAVFGIVDQYDQGIVSQESEWVIDASMELNYFFILAAVAYLWRPSPNAKEYAYVMQLPAINADNGEENMVEMTGVVPSAMDDEEEEDEINGKQSSFSNGGGFRDEPDDVKA